MKKLIILPISIAFFAILLSACTPPLNEESERPNQRLTKNGLAFTDLNQTHILLTLQERGLERNHGYNFIYRGDVFDSIAPPSSDPVDWLQRYEFYKDGLKYASNLIFLKQNEKRFIRENKNLYGDLVRKTKAMTLLVFRPTYTFTLSSLKELESFHYDVTPVLFLDFLDLKLYSYSYSPNGATHNALEWSRSARKMCEQLLILTDLNILSLKTLESCSNHPKAQILSALTPEESIKYTIKRVNQSLLSYYDDVASQMMKASEIFLNSKSNVGYDLERRSQYEQRVLAQNSHHPTALIKTALTNNLFENLFFKIKVLTTKEGLFGNNPQISYELELAQRAFEGLKYNEVNLRLGKSPFNFDIDIGFKDLRNISTIDKSDIQTSTPQREVQRTEPTPTPDKVEKVDDGNSSTAPLNSGPAPIIVPKAVEDFFSED